MDNCDNKTVEESIQLLKEDEDLSKSNLTPNQLKK